MTPVNASLLHDLLKVTGYDAIETEFLYQGFSKGFSIGYSGPTNRRDTSNNIPFTVGNSVDMWNKIMKEVRAKRVAGPFGRIPYDCYMQSPIGLVPKAGGKTRLIFHLSYDFTDQEIGRSLNHHTPQEARTVSYNDLDVAVDYSLRFAQGYGEQHLPVVYAKSDLVSAFRMLPLSPGSWPWVIFKARNPVTGEICFFVEKSLPFGAGVSCSHYQRFSNSLRHLIEYYYGRSFTVVNYLDDFLFIEQTAGLCNRLVRVFLQICKTLGIPVSLEKTQWASSWIVFLGIMLDGVNFTLSIPEEKRDKALVMLELFSDKRKSTVKHLQVLTGYLNFLSRAIVPGRAFTRRIYAKFSNLDRTKLKHYHHVALDAEFRFDCQVWKLFLLHSSSTTICRPMIDLDRFVSARELCFYTDSSARHDLGCGGIFNQEWFCLQWEPDYIKKNKPSIEYLELFAVCAGVLTWCKKLTNLRAIVFCDNKSVVDMINSSSSKCKNCMYLIRLLVLNGLIHNTRVFCKHVLGKQNLLADSLSRLKFHKFRRHGKHMKRYPTRVSTLVWPASKIWHKV